MVEETVEKRVLRIVSQVLELNEKEIDHKATFESLGADLHKRTELISKLNEEFPVPISDEELTTVEETIEYFEKNNVIW